MKFYSNFQEFCEKNNLSKAEGIKILENEIDKMNLNRIGKHGKDKRGLHS